MIEEIKAIIAAAYDAGRKDGQQDKPPKFVDGQSYAEYVYTEIIEPAFKAKDISL